MNLYDVLISQIRSIGVGDELTIDVVKKALSTGPFRNLPERKLRIEVIAAFRRAEHEGFGKYIRGNRGYPSRFLRAAAPESNGSHTIQVAFGLDGTTLAKVEFKSDLTDVQRDHLYQQLKGILRIL